MRLSVHDNTPLLAGYADHQHGRELEEIDRILSLKPHVLELVREDLEQRSNHAGTGRLGMTADQVLRALIVKRLRRFTYRALEFHLADSQSYQTFCRVGVFEKSPTKSRLQSNIKQLRPATLELINREVLGFAAEEGIESGKQVRTDGTVVATNIHAPTDSSLLFDVVRVLSRLMRRAKKDFGISGKSHVRRAKRRVMEIINTKTTAAQSRPYQDLLKVTRKSMRCGLDVAAKLRSVKTGDMLAQILAQKIADELEHFAELGEVVAHQTRERVILGHQVPQDEKLFSIFEVHTDIIIKDRREVQFGHKVTFTTGKSNLILDCVVEEGNPADATLAVRTIKRQIDLYERPPEKSSMDGAYASKKNLKDIKDLGVKDVVFSKKRGLKEEDMASSSWIFRKLRNFRAGIEAGISFLKRCFGLDRCTWKGFRAFRSYVWSSVLSANLLILARHRLAARDEQAATLASASA